jgi:hypothetical protein
LELFRQPTLAKLNFTYVLDRHERQPGEEPPIGRVLCAGKSDERVELLELEKTGIRVAQYLTELPPREILQKRLHEAMVSARAQLEIGTQPDSAAL